jgi:Na(+)-translocating NADH:ubiquinone oxidoreductase F subunit
MTPWIRRLHRWFGLVIALQFVIWMGSGLMMSLIDHERVQGEHHRTKHEHAAKSWPADAASPAQALAAAKRPAQRLDTVWLLDQPAWRFAFDDTEWLLDARTLEPLAVDAALALAIAKADYTGNGAAGTPQRLEQATLEVREHKGPIWRIDFADADATTLYVSAHDGEILERRNDTWRLFDIFWMLHIMDYTGRQNFNNPLVILLAVGGLWIALSGVWLMVTSFRAREFVPARWRARRPLTVLDTAGTELRSIESHDGDTVYVAMARHGLHLPSNCGGGQSCGLCEVRVCGTAPAPTASDRDHLGDSRVRAGHRLACNLAIEDAPRIEVAAGANLWTECTATVERVVAVTPFLREIVLAPATPPGPDFQPGAYLQVHVPTYAFGREAIAHPDEHRSDWSALDLPATLANKDAVRRSYSLALPITASEGRLTLLARFSPGRQDKKKIPSGKGSTYLYALKPGDTVRYSGPFGDFALKDGAREKVFIGGGAGMAPLRAMIRARLDAGATERIHYWYGARSLREAPYVEEMAALAQRHANFSWHLVLSDEPGALTGMVHEAAHANLLAGHGDLAACEFYLCGPPAMLAATRKLLTQLGIAPDRVAFDDFKI